MDKTVQPRKAVCLTAWQKWLAHVEDWKECQRCDLCAQRDRIVLARGSIPCDVLFVGEAPGASENVIGQPFVGPAGILLDQIVAQSVPPSLKWAMTNLVACYPQEAKEAKTNEPEDSEILSCRPRLKQFIDICQPKLIVTVGKLADKWLPTDARNYSLAVTLGSDPVLCHVVTITHPAAILRMPLVQRDFAVQKSIVTIATAVDSLEATCSRP